MGIDKQTLERLSNLELRQYAGDLSAIKGEDKILYNRLFGLPVEVEVILQRGICEDKLYEICLEFQRRYKRFIDLKVGITTRLSNEFTPPGWNLLSVLFDGIYIGEPEDLLNYRQGNQKGIIHQTKGIGGKVAEVTFI